ncbi:translation elongation factor G2 protein [Rutstroemia sp. NJR-2017a WRK4]|nr:translation elongation factor G2 protein [Rutstroemia sp. NJR-2017a WRK4]PQE11836.1 translation elongation factor G2 protein [Rutstroemia sp. NJR-2017a WRK4]
MERKRKLPARGSRSEPANKKRNSTPPERTPAPSAAPTPPPQPPPVVENPLPKSITAGAPLPTLKEPQPENLSSKEFQTISESGVLVESLQRSRQKWVSEGIFEKYWTKPTKKKGQPSEPPNNPGKDTMTKLGTCTITIEPHIFDATMYAIKEPKSAIPPQQQMYRPIIQYGPPNGVMPPPAPVPAPAPAPVQQKPIPITQPLNTPAPHPPTSTAPPPPNSAVPNRAPINGPPTRPPNTANPSQPPRAAPPAQPVTNRSTDPVIQMLAERAATDADLKGLMRIVANGEASAAELKKFQNHIDELTQLLRTRQAGGPPPNSTHPPPLPPTAQTNGQIKSEPVAIPSPSPIKTLPTPTPTPTPPYPPPQPQALRSKGPVAPPKPDISGIVFEFAGGNGDRFLFPKYSILDYLPNGQVIASFLIVRKGSASDSPTYDPQLDYYQPVTIRLYTHQGKQLESLQKVVAPAEEVRRYMDDVMDNMTRAEYVLLAMRLPKDTEATTSDKEDEVVKTEKPDGVPNQVLWQTTNPPPAPTSTPQAAMKVQRLLTEDEKYQTFITKVAASPAA